MDQQASIKTPGQIAYEADVAARPYYDDGGRRKDWADLCPTGKATWERNPTSRFKTEVAA